MVRVDGHAEQLDELLQKGASVADPSVEEESFGSGRVGRGDRLRLSCRSHSLAYLMCLFQGLLVARPAPCGRTKRRDPCLRGNVQVAQRLALLGEQLGAVEHLGRAAPIGQEGEVLHGDRQTQGRDSTPVAEIDALLARSERSGRPMPGPELEREVVVQDGGLSALASLERQGERLPHVGETPAVAENGT